ncbi:hypothetical protein PV11_07919 [Exophiala sideris]|uniref:CBF1-interacting co-repressor CIR N-terminal domain-containing protein n=1 Tax=Exophiala sideris TaxID=1016849 RepID=A0A0D1YHH0_9EURO|nr:hypothetical protein PV11_07919 [Exophiala sideris]
MPLHLLGKKSWNVYNPANIDRVKRDEAEAKQHEEEKEAQNQKDEADARLRLLRGDAAAPLPKPVQSQIEAHSSRRHNKRKLPGEDDTDREIRLARAPHSQPLPAPAPTAKNDDSIVDANGNIALVPIPEHSNVPPAKKPRLDEDPYTVYLSHATGRGKESGEKPWYSNAPDPDQRSKSWGDANPRRHDREAARIAANDPLAAIKKGVKQLREADKQRKEWMAQRERDLKEVEEFARQKRRRDRHEKRRKRRDSGEDDRHSLEGFDLDVGYTEPRDREHDSELRSKHHRHDHHHRHRDRHHREHSPSHSLSHKDANIVREQR